jgi:CTP:phosphocholine cytidylyltransferase-like protein
MNCIILGDKYNKGMKSKGCCGLIKFNNKLTILENQYHILKSIFPTINIVYIYGFEDKRFIDFVLKRKLEITPVLNSNYNKYNQSYSLYLAKNFLQESSIILGGYVTLNKPMIKKINKKENYSQIFLSDTEKRDNIPGCIVVDDSIKNFSFNLSNNIKEIYYLNRSTSRLLQSILKEDTYNYFLFELMNKIIAKKHILQPIMV